MNSTEFCQNDGYCRSQGNIELKLVRKSREILGLIGSYFGPTLAFSILSLISYSIPVENVPGRMGLLVTLYLIATNTYISVNAPDNRGLSYLDIWIFGTQLPIIFGILEYGILLWIQKYSNGCIFEKRIDYKRIDVLTFMFSLFFILIFDLTYWIIGMKK